MVNMAYEKDMPLRRQSGVERNGGETKQKWPFLLKTLRTLPQVFTRFLHDSVR